MQIPVRSSLLRVFVGEDDRANGLPLYEAIVLKARAAHLAGATVFRGQLGFGRSSRLHTAHTLRLSQDLPFVIEIIDTESKIEAFLPALTALTNSCLITMEKVNVFRADEEAGIHAVNVSTG